MASLDYNTTYQSSYEVALSFKFIDVVKIPKKFKSKKKKQKP